MKLKHKKELIKLIDTRGIVNPPMFSEIFEGLKNRSVFIYGAGSFGIEIFRLFKEHSVGVHAFLDIKATPGAILCNIPVYRADDPCLTDAIKQDAIVLFSIVTDKFTRLAIYEFVKKCGFKIIINAQSIRCRLVNAENNDKEVLDQEYLKTHQDVIVNGIDLWADDESVITYAANVSAHITRSYDACIESDEITQYFLKNIKFSKGFSRFIDCGGYIGDTLAELVSTQGKTQAVASFEPNIASFNKLGNKANELREDIKELYLFPCGVSNRTEMTWFNTLGGSSAITEDGETCIQCVALDEVLKGFAPTFIKMDVEGSEYNALLGARNLITEYRPDLAICVYHKVNHLWDIPLLIQSWNLDYHFYLRAHNACTMETVMYAVSDY